MDYSLRIYARALASRDNPVKVFDWEQAARIIKKTGATSAQAGLIEENEWGYTADTIWDGDLPHKLTSHYDGPYLASTWATPTLGYYSDEEGWRYVECWAWQTDTPGWDEKTYWPQSALDILEKGLNEADYARPPRKD